MTHNMPPDAVHLELLRYSGKGGFEDELEKVLGSVQDNFPEQLNELRELLKKKHHDYGSNNLKKRGLFGIQVRLDDKFARLDTLLKNNGDARVNDESIKDTWRDIAGYSIMAICLMDDNL